MSSFEEILAGSRDYTPSVVTPAEAADLIEVSLSELERLMRELEIEPDRLAPGEEYLMITDVLRLAQIAKRAALEEVAGGILELTEERRLDEIEDAIAEINEFFAKLPPAVAAPPEEFIAELHEHLPAKDARQAEKIYRHFTDAPSERREKLDELTRLSEELPGGYR